jgi:hypothetical protein
MESLSSNLQNAVELIYESSNVELPAAQENYSAYNQKIYLLKKAIESIEDEIKILEPPSMFNDPMSYGGKSKKYRKVRKTRKAKRNHKKI